MALRYTFNEIKTCNMCGRPAESSKVLGKRLNRSQGIFPNRKKGITTTVVKCGQCGLVYSNPQPVPVDMQDHYGVPPESYWTDNYFRIDDTYFSHEIGTLKKLYNFTPGDKALDIGAGLGKAMIAMEKAGFDVYGFEPSVSFHEQGLKKMRMDPNRYTLQTMENAFYKPDTFDFISFGAVLEHLYDPSEGIHKAMKWLKPGGIMHIEVPSAKWLTNRIINFIYRVCGTDYVANISPMHAPFHLYEFTLDSFKMNGGAGSKYGISLFEYYVCPEFTYLPKLLNVLTVPYMKYTNTGMQLCVWLRKNL